MVVKLNGIKAQLLTSYKSPVANHSFPLLLGLRLRFCLRGKYSDVFNYFFLRNSYICFGQFRQQQQTESCIRYAQFFINMNSKFKLGSILLILIINFLSGLLFCIFFIEAEINPFKKEFWNGESAKIAGITIIILEIVALSFLSQVKQIIIEKDKIVFKNLILPFIKKERLFSYYDYSKIVEEQTKSGTYEALWLIKNEKLEDQISSFYYSNYTKLKFEIKVKHSGKLKINSFKQLFCRIGMRV